jgi:hypothetical protein
MMIIIIIIDVISIITVITIHNVPPQRTVKAMEHAPNFFANWGCRTSNFVRELDSCILYRYLR